MSSRLFQELREARGLAYSIYAWAQPFADTGMLGVYCAAQRAQAGKAHVLAQEILARTAETLDDAELARAKAQAKAPMQSLVSIDDVGMATAYLATDAAKLITGETIYIDGGYHIID